MGGWWCDKTIPSWAFFQESIGKRAHFFGLGHWKQFPGFRGFKLMQHFHFTNGCLFPGRLLLLLLLLLLLTWACFLVLFF